MWHINRFLQTIGPGAAERKKGESVKLRELFDAREADFVTTDVLMHGEEEQVEHLCPDLL